MEILHIFGEIFCVLYVFGMLYVLPGIVYWTIVPFDALKYPYWIGVAVVGFINLLMLVEAICAHHWRKKCQQAFEISHLQSAAPVTILAVVSAYLPNEITVLEETLTHM